VDNARFFFDVELGRDAGVDDARLLDAVRLFFEWDLVREGELKNKAGSLLVRFENLFGLDPLDIEMGRIAIPFSAEYTRFSEDRPDDPLLGFSAAAPYGWDEGVAVTGTFDEGLVEYKLAFMDGDNGWPNTDSRVAVVGRLTVSPLSWLSVSASGIDSGPVGLGGTALEFAGSHAVVFGSGTEVPNFQGGVEVDDDPSETVENLRAWEADLVLDKDRWGRLWLEYGQAWIDSTRSDADRQLYYFIAELRVDLALVANSLDRFYLASRYSVIGTADSDEGYLLQGLVGGGDVGFNTTRLTLLTVGAGVNVVPGVTFKGEYTKVDIDTVDGFPDTLADTARGRSYGGLGVSVGW
jgi:hypothetical protein